MPEMTSLEQAIAQYLQHLVSCHGYKISELSVEIDEDLRLVFTRKRGENVETWTIEPIVLSDDDSFSSDSEDEDDDPITASLDCDWEHFGREERER
jgi:hypothetical protein